MRFIGVTGHGLSVPKMHTRSLGRFDFDSVLCPYNFVQMRDDRYAQTFDELAALCAERDVALQTIKSLARAPWEGREKTASTWYEPLTDQADIDHAVHWVLGNPQVFLLTTGDVDVLPKLLDAAARYETRPGDEEMESLRAHRALHLAVGLPGHAELGAVACARSSRTPRRAAARRSTRAPAARPTRRPISRPGDLVVVAEPFALGRAAPEVLRLAVPAERPEVRLQRLQRLELRVDGREAARQLAPHPGRRPARQLRVARAGRARPDPLGRRRRAALPRRDRRTSASGSAWGRGRRWLTAWAWATPCGVGVALATGRDGSSRPPRARTPPPRRRPAPPRRRRRSTRPAATAPPRSAPGTPAAPSRSPSARVTGGCVGCTADGPPAGPRIATGRLR